MCFTAGQSIAFILFFILPKLSLYKPFFFVKQRRQYG